MTKDDERQFQSVFCGFFFENFLNKKDTDACTKWWKSPNLSIHGTVF